jgi:hypothetical protein
MPVSSTVSLIAAIFKTKSVDNKSSFFTFSTSCCLVFEFKNIEGLQSREKIKTCHYYYFFINFHQISFELKKTLSFIPF